MAIYYTPSADPDYYDLAQVELMLLPREEEVAIRLMHDNIVDWYRNHRDMDHPPAEIS